MNGRANLEREVKLSVPDGFSLARLPREIDGYIASPPRFLRLHTIYYDSADLRLMRWGCSLRFRRDEGWTLKIPVIDAKAGNELARTEHVYDEAPDRVPAGALDLASAFLRGAPVRPVAELRTLRVRRDFACDGSSVAEVVEDDVRVVEDSHVAQRFAQLEIELAGDVDRIALDAITSVLRDRGAGKPDRVAKNEQALAGGASAPEIAVPRLDETSTARDVVRAALGSALVQYICCEPQLRSGNEVEALHKARVAIRKLRSHLHTFVPVLDERWALDLRDRLRALQDALAPVRDADVFAQRMSTLAQRLPHPDIAHARALLDSLERRAQEEHDGLRAYLRSEPYLVLLDAIVAAIREPRFAVPEASAAVDVLDTVMQRVYKKVRKAVRRAGPQPSDRGLHRIRIKAKHLRYAAEAFADVSGDDASSYAARIEDLQEMLGAQHDGVVAVQRLRAFAGTPVACFAAGELAILAFEEGSRACDRWRARWRTISKKRNRFW